MIDKRLSEISKVDLDDLVTNSVRESKTLEYKSMLAAGTRDERKELLADITALANTAGGDLLFGVEESQGEAAALPGIAIDNWDALERMLSSLIRDGTEPRLQGIEFSNVQVSDGRYVLIVRVRRSYRRPHRVVLSGHGHFYARDSAQKYRMDVEDLRRAFTFATSASETLEQFRSERAAAIAADAGFSPVPGPPRLIAHLVPEDSLHGDFEVEFQSTNLELLRPLPRAALGFSPRVNHKGHFVANEYAYTAVFRTGIVEAVEEVRTHKGMLFPTSMQLDLIEGLKLYMLQLEAFQVDPPVHILITLQGVNGFMFPRWSINSFIRPLARFQEADLLLRSVTVDGYGADIATVLRPAFDHFWNAFGYHRCEDYDETGAWQPRDRPIVA